MLGVFRVPIPGKSPADVTCSAGLRLRESARATGGLNNGRIFAALEEPRTSRLLGQSERRQRTLTQAEVDTEVHPLVPSSNDQQEMVHRGRRLLESVAAEVARQTKRVLSPSRCPALRFAKRASVLARWLFSDRVDAESQVKSVALLGPRNAAVPQG